MVARVNCQGIDYWLKLKEDQSVESVTLKCLFLLFLIFSCISPVFLIEIGSFLH